MSKVIIDRTQPGRIVVTDKYGDVCTLVAAEYAATTEKMAYVSDTLGACIDSPLVEKLDLELWDATEVTT